MCFKRDDRMKKLLEFVKNLIIFVYILVIIFVTICLLSYNDYKLTVFGSNTLVPVIDEDLKPSYSVGDLLIIKKNDISEVNVGDSVFFYQTRSGETAINIAKVTDLEKLTESETTITIEGDFRFSSTNFVGKTSTATVVPKLGMILGTLESKWGFLFLGVFPSLLVFLYTLYSVVLEFYDVKTTSKSDGKKSVKVKEDEEDEEKSSKKVNTGKDKEEKKDETKVDVVEDEVKAKDKTDDEADSSKEKKDETNSNNSENDSNTDKDRVEVSESSDVKADMEDLKNIFKSPIEKKEDRSEDEEKNDEEIEENKDVEKTEEKDATTEKKELSAEEKKALIEEKMKTLTPEQKKALIEAKLKSMTPEQKKALIEAKRKKLEEQNNGE